MIYPKTLTKQGRLRRHGRLPVLEQERKFMELSHELKWGTRILGIAPIPEAPVFVKDSMIVPSGQDNSPIPDRAMERVKAMYARGIYPKAFLVVHEAPQELAAPANAPKGSLLEFWIKRLGSASLPIIKVAGIMIAAVVIPAVVAVFGIGLLAMVGLATAVMVDPALIAAIEIEGDEQGRCLWLLVDNWVV